MRFKSNRNGNNLNDIINLCDMSFSDICPSDIVHQVRIETNLGDISFHGISGCPWPKATLKSPVGARDLGPL